MTSPPRLALVPCINCSSISSPIPLPRPPPLLNGFLVHSRSDSVPLVHPPSWMPEPVATKDVFAFPDTTYEERTSYSVIPEVTCCLTPSPISTRAPVSSQTGGKGRSHFPLLSQLPLL